MRIYNLGRYGWEDSQHTLLYNHTKDYSKEEFYDLCATLYVNESDELLQKIIKSNPNLDPEGMKNTYLSPKRVYFLVIQQLKHHGFHQIIADVSFNLDESDNFLDEDEDEDENICLDLIREKYKQKIREKKLKRITE